MKAFGARRAVTNRKRREEEETKNYAFCHSLGRTWFIMWIFIYKNCNRTMKVNYVLLTK